MKAKSKKGSSYTREMIKLKTGIDNFTFELYIAFLSFLLPKPKKK